MNSAQTVSLEFLNVGSSTLLPADILAAVGRFREVMASTGMLPDYHGKELKDIIRKNTGLLIDVIISREVSDIFIYVPMFQGHRGNGATTNNETTGVSARHFDKDIMVSTVDLEKVRVTGAFTDVPAVMLINTALFSPLLAFSDEEITSLILHEIGHAFFALATLGEYVWLNYFLQDGVDVVLGKKPNTYKVEILTQAYLEKNIEDKALAEQIKTQPTETNVRRALLQEMGEVARDYFNTRIGLGAFKRNEQLADQFATRLGYGKHLVKALDKVHRNNSSQRRYYRTRLDVLVIEALKLGAFGLGAALSPWVPVVVTASVLFGTAREIDQYDNITERLLKIKRDLIAQLKQSETTPAFKEALIDDLKSVDEVTKNMTQYRTLLELVVQTAIPTRRRDYQRLKLEQRLEQLLNNDLFAVSAKLNQLT